MVKRNDEDKTTTNHEESAVSNNTKQQQQQLQDTAKDQASSSSNVNDIAQALQQVHLEDDASPKASYNSQEEDSPVVPKAKDQSTTVPSSSSSSSPLVHSLPKTTPVPLSSSLQTFASWISQGDISNVLVVTGAGISVSAGIPDFRTPGTGLYDNLQKYNLPYPEAVFDLEFFTSYNHQPFVTLATELWPTGQTFRPTITHSFLTLLARKNKLLRVYSQNIDGLEHLAELPVDKLVECHGHFRSASCTQCGKPAPDMQVIQNIILKKSQVPRCTYCKTGKIKPDIVFFGEGLPMRFHDLLPRDLKQADCCLVLGTSLQVAPVSNIPEQVPTRCRRMLLNRELVGPFSSRSSKRPHDLHHLGDCDDSIRSLAHALGWRDELEEMHQKLGSSSPK